MKGHDDIIALLNDVLTAELTAINQYFIHARMCENWGYERLWKKVREESIGEMRHADQLIARILYLEGVPNVQRLGKVNVGADRARAVPPRPRGRARGRGQRSTPASSSAGASATTARAISSRRSSRARRSTSTGSRRSSS